MFFWFLVLVAVESRPDRTLEGSREQDRHETPGKRGSFFWHFLCMAWGGPEVSVDLKLAVVYRPMLLFAGGGGAIVTAVERALFSSQKGGQPRINLIRAEGRQAPPTPFPRETPRNHPSTICTRPLRMQSEPVRPGPYRRLVHSAVLFNILSPVPVHVTFPTPASSFSPFSLLFPSLANSIIRRCRRADAR